MAYRNELEAAHARIRQLEAAQRPAPPLPPRSNAWLVAVPLLVLVAVIVGGVVIAARRQVAVASAPAATVTVVPHVPVQWYPQTHVAPIVLDLDFDGVDDLIGLFWEAGNDPQNLHVVAIRGSNLEPIWHAGPFPAQWSSARTHLISVGGRLVLTDTQSRAHVLERSTGIETATFTLSDAPLEACTRGSEALVLMDMRNGWQSLDLSSGALARAKGGIAKDEVVRCDGVPLRCDAKGATSPCLMPLEDAPRLPEGLYLREGFEDGEDRVAVLYGDEGDTALAGWRGHERVPRWRVPIAVAGDEIHYPRKADVSFEDGRVIVTYPTKAGPFRILARDATTGAIAWKAMIPDTAEGSNLMSVLVRNKRVYVVSDQKLTVFDATTGDVLQKVRTISVERSARP